MSVSGDGFFITSAPQKLTRVVVLHHFHLFRLVSASESSGHSGREELAGDLGQCGDYDGGLLPESVPGFGQEEGGPDYHRL